MPDQIIRYLNSIEYIIKIWQKRTTLALLQISSFILYIMFLKTQIDFAADTIQGIFFNTNYYRNITFVYILFSLSLYVIWVGSRKLPKIKKGQIGIVIAILPENEKDGSIVKKDFINNIRNEISRTTNSDFRVISLSSYHSTRLVEKKSLVIKYHEVTKANLIIWGTSSIRKHNGEDCYVLSLYTSIYHGQINIQNHKVLQSELNSLFPINNLIPLQNEYLGFRISSNCFALSARYIIGIACFFSNKIDLAFKIHTDILQQITLNDDLQEFNIISRIRNNTKLFVLDEATIIITKLYKSNRLPEMEQYIRLIDTLDKDSYQSLLLKSIYYFLKDRDINKALNMINKASINKTDYTWAYNKAFLEAYSGNMEAAYKTYRTAFENISALDAPMQVEEFIFKILDIESDKYQLWYCLGLVNMKKKEDYELANEYFSKFIEENSKYHKFDRIIEFATKMRNKCILKITSC